MLSDVEVEDAPTIVSEHYEDEQDAKARDGNGEEIDGDQIRDVIGQERAPGLRGRCAALRDEPGDGALGHAEAELQQLTMDSRVGRPERLVQCLRRRRRRHRRTVSGVTITRDCLQPGPNPGQRHPEEPIFRAEFRPGPRLLVHGELLTQGQVFEGEVAWPPKEEREETTTCLQTEVWRRIRPNCARSAGAVAATSYFPVQK